MSKLKRLENVLLFLTLLFLPTQLGRHFWPEFSYIYSLRVDYLSPTIYFWDLLVLALNLVWLLSSPKISRLATNLLFLFLLTQIVSIVQSSSIGAGIVRAQQYLVAGLFGVYLASSDFDSLKAKLFWPVGLGVLGEGILALLQFIKGGTLGLWILGERTFTIQTPGIAKFDFYGYEFLRPYGTFPHPNVLAAFLVVGVAFLVWVIHQGFSVRLWFLRLATTFALMATLLTVSRTAILAALASAFFFLRPRWLIIFLGLLILLSPILYTRFSALFSFDSLTILRREQLDEGALKMFSNSPIFGVGLNNFIIKGSQEVVTGPSRFLQPVHNIYLLTLAETGIVGFVGFFILIGTPIYMLFKLNPKPYPLYPIFLIWIIILFLGVFDHYFLTLPQGYRLLFLIWGISLSTRT